MRLSDSKQKTLQREDSVDHESTRMNSNDRSGRPFLRRLQRPIFETSGLISIGGRAFTRAAGVFTTGGALEQPYE